MKRSFFILFAVAVFMTATAMGELAGYWKFDDGSGTTAIDSSGKGKNGVLRANGSGALPQWITGHDEAGGAILLNSTTTSYTLSDNVLVTLNSTDALADLTKTGRAFTVSMWVRSDALVPSRWRYTIYTDAYDLRLAMDPNDPTDGSTSTHDFFWSDANVPWRTDLLYETAVQKPLGVWMHLAIVFDGNYIKKYVNGKLIICYLPAPLEAHPIASTNLFIGSKSDWRNYFIGGLDDLAIWSGTYLSDEEVVKLANGTTNPLTATEHLPDAQLPVYNWEAEEGFGWNCGVAGKAWNYGYYNNSTGPGWEACWSQGYAQQIRLLGNAGKTAWSAYSQDWVLNPLLAGTRSAVYSYNSHAYPVKFVNDANIYEPNWSGKHPDVNTHGVAWIDSSWHPGDTNGVNTIATIASYITPGYGIIHGSFGYKVYDPDPCRPHASECIPYFKTYARFATENAPAGCKFLIKLYTTPTYPDAPHPITNGGSYLTYYNKLEIPIVVGNHQWQEFKGTLPKPIQVGGSGDYPDRMPRVWFELSIQGGDEDTVLYIDEFAPISDQFIQHVAMTSIYRDGDINQNSIIYYDDIKAEHDSWLNPYDLFDYADTTGNWMMPLYNNISGDPCDSNW